MPSTYEIKQLHTSLKAQWSQDSGLSFEEWLVERLATERLLSEIEHQTVERYEAVLIEIKKLFRFGSDDDEIPSGVYALVTEALKEAE